jgi:AraC-like DNA-binding protein
MGDMLIRGLSEAALARIDADAAARGLSRQEYLRRRFEREGAVSPSQRSMTIDDLRRAGAAAADLDDPHVMESAWR